jgi:hypothetical protein
MTDTIDHIICGGAGKNLGEKSILIYDHTVLNAAIRLNHEELVHTYGWSLEEALAFGKKIQADYDKWIKKLAKRGIPTHVYEPHAQNFK